jgi:rhodanese-related sulfurtransferase
VWLVVARPVAAVPRRRATSTPPAATPTAATPTGAPSTPAATTATSARANASAPPVSVPVASAATNPAVDDVALKLSASTRIYIDEFKALHDASNVLVIDVRDKESFRAGRIPGALLIPSDKVADYVEALRAERRLIVAYCSCPAEETSLPVVQTLANHGITNAKALVGGYRLWVAEKNPIAKGEEPCNGPQCPIKPKPTSDAR